MRSNFIFLIAFTVSNVALGIGPKSRCSIAIAPGARIGGAPLGPIVHKNHLPLTWLATIVNGAIVKTANRQPILRTTAEKRVSMKFESGMWLGLGTDIGIRYESYDFSADEISQLKNGYVKVIRGKDVYRSDKLIIVEDKVLTLATKHDTRETNGHMSLTVDQLDLPSILNEKSNINWMRVLSYSWQNNSWHLDSFQEYGQVPATLQLPSSSQLLIVH